MAALIGRDAELLFLEQAIEQHGVSQVIEVAAGLSARGWRFVERYGDQLTYVETDLPEMAARKRRALERIGTLSERHRVIDLTNGNTGSSTDTNAQTIPVQK